MFWILKQENITISDEQKPRIAQIVKDNFPDVRKTINIIQKYSISGSVNITTTAERQEVVKMIYRYLFEKDVIGLRKYLIENETEFQGDYHSLLKSYLNFIYASEQDDDEKKRQMIVIIADHMYRDSFVVDKEVNSFSCFIQLEKLS